MCGVATDATRSAQRWLDTDLDAHLDACAARERCAGRGERAQRGDCL
jgi:hypothetical protein